MYKAKELKASEKTIFGILLPIFLISKTNKRKDYDCLILGIDVTKCIPF